MHIFHDWAPWSGVIVGYDGRRTQWRRCKDCGHIQHRSEGYAHGVDAKAINDTLMPIGQHEIASTAHQQQEAAGHEQ